MSRKVTVELTARQASVLLDACITHDLHLEDKGNYDDEPGETYSRDARRDRSVLNRATRSLVTAIHAAEDRA